MLLSVDGGREEDLADRNLPVAVRAHDEHLQLRYIKMDDRISAEPLDMTHFALPFSFRG